jgi:hypothetical protein
VERIRKISTESIVKFMENKAQTEPIRLRFKVPMDFLAAFFSGALLSIVDWWLEEDMRHTPEEMARLFQSLFFKGAVNMLEVVDQPNNS